MTMWGWDCVCMWLTETKRATPELIDMWGPKECVFIICSSRACLYISEPYAFGGVFVGCCVLSSQRGCVSMNIVCGCVLPVRASCVGFERCCLPFAVAVEAPTPVSLVVLSLLAARLLSACERAPSETWRPTESV